MALNPVGSAELEAMGRAHERWGVPPPTGPMKREGLLHLLAAIESRIPQMPCRVVPTSFDPDDSKMRAFPRSINWRWVSCERALRAFNVERGVLMRLPLFWQMESPLHAACRAVGVPIFVNEPENMPVAAAVAAAGDIDAVVTDEEDARAFSKYLTEKNIQSPHIWLIVHPVDAPVWDIPAALREERIGITQEVHLFPGVPILEQCLLLWDKKSPRFHLTDGYFLEMGEGGTLLSGAGEDPLPLIRYTLPGELYLHGHCPCGKVVVGRA